MPQPHLGERITFSIRLKKKIYQEFQKFCKKQKRLNKKQKMVKMPRNVIVENMILRDLEEAKK